MPDSPNFSNKEEEKDVKTIRIKLSTYNRLCNVAHYESMDEIINRLLDLVVEN